MTQLKLPAGEQKRKLKEIKQLWLDFLADNKSTSYDGERKKKNERRTAASVIQQARCRTIESMNEKIFGNWNSADLNDEYDEYIAERSLQDMDNVLAWWQEPTRRNRWPILSQFATEMLSIPPMSDEVERVFSGGRRTISWDRSRLNPETIEAIECFQHWLSQAPKG